MDIPVQNFCNLRHNHQLYMETFKTKDQAELYVKTYFFNKCKKETHGISKDTLIYKCVAKKNCTASLRIITNKKDDSVIVQGKDFAFNNF